MVNFRPFAPPLLLLVLFAIAFAGCAPAPSGPRAPASAGGPSLAGTKWRLVNLAGSAVLDGVEATLEFPEAGKVSGRASCNRFFGTAEVSADSIVFGPLASTKMSCGDAVDAQERKYLAALQDAGRLAFEGSELLVYPRGLERPLRFRRR